MAFNSWEFAVFLILVFGLYALFARVKAQNALLLVASYWFYAAWKWELLGLILFSTLVDYVAGQRIASAPNPHAKKAWLCVSMVTNLGLLAVFKYAGWFLESLEALSRSLGVDPGPLRLDIILPVGISFYTFQTMSYSLDIYRNKLAPAKNPLNFALFVAFFPQLVAGPIERASALLPQIERPRTITRAGLESGLWLIFWGLWKKIVIADNLALIADPLFANSANLNFGLVWIAAFAFAFQIYCDFSAYSDIARGVSRLMGFELMINFNLPYIARDPSDFWRRWHISLSTWLRDYLYIPLGGNRGSALLTYRNLMLTMGLGGLWHGASWNYIWWGLYHGAILCGHRLLNRRDAAEPLKRGRALLSMALMFQFTLFGWLLFRATRRVEVAPGITRDDSAAQLLELLSSPARGLGLDAESGAILLRILLFIAPLLFLQWHQWRRQDPICVARWPLIGRAAFFALLLFYWLRFGVQGGSAFIYFQF